MKLKRPKSDGRCIHCREKLNRKTKDHVFPNSWYPETTPKNIERWTAPSCGLCNEKFGALEKELLVFFALCMDPTKPAARGLYATVRRTMGIGVEGLLAEEKAHRDALRRKILNGLKPMTPEMLPHILPGLGPHPGFPQAPKMKTTVEAENVLAVIKKIARGSEFWLANGRIVEPPYEIEIFFPQETPDLITAVLNQFPLGQTHLGPGLQIRRGHAQDDPRAVLYELIMWDTLTAYASILPTETN